MLICFPLVCNLLGFSSLKAEPGDELSSFVDEVEESYFQCIEWREDEMTGRERGDLHHPCCLSVPA